MKHSFNMSLHTGWLFTDMCKASKRIQSIFSVSGLVSVNTDTTDTTQYLPIPDTSIICYLQRI